MTPTETLIFLQEVPLFADLTVDEFAQLADICRERGFDKGHAIFYADDQGTSFYVSAKGSVKIVVLADDGREHILGVLRAQDFFGEMSLLDGEARSATAIALENTQVLSISREDFQSVLRRNPDISLKIMVTICRRLRRADRRVESLAFLSAPGRVARVLMEMGKEHGERTAEGLSLHHKMTRQELANIAGTSRETLTRVLMEFQDEGLLTLKKNVLIVHDEKQLASKMI
jgi:CRP/FNR family cyclic AMP-dependent transcriptional regulator